MPLVYKEFIVARINSRQWATRRALNYRGKNQNLHIPRGFVTDFATVPRIFMSLFPSTGAYTLAATVHDWLCIMLAARTSPMSSVDADGVFRRISREEGTGFVTRWAMWTGVRWGALFNYNRREGWWRTAHLVIPWTIMLLPGVLVAAVGVGIALLWLGLLGGIAWICRVVSRR